MLSFGKLIDRLSQDCCAISGTTVVSRAENCRSARLGSSGPSARLGSARLGFLSLSQFQLGKFSRYARVALGNIIQLNALNKTSNSYYCIKGPLKKHVNLKSSVFIQLSAVCGKVVFRWFNLASVSCVLSKYSQRLMLRI